MKKENITENPRYVVLGVFIAMAALTAGLIAANSSLNNITESGADGLTGGEFEGETLEELNTSGFYWFVWEKFQPETEVFAP